MRLNIAMCIKDVELPSYNLKEELINAISHGLGAIFAIIVTVFMLYKVIPTNDVINIIAVIIYGISLLILFLTSCLYHSLPRNNAKKVFRILDHNMIFVLVSGTYTPYTLIALRNQNIFHLGQGTFAYIILGFVYLASIVGIIFNSINIKKYSRLSLVCYILTGWAIVLAVYPLIQTIGEIGTLLLFGGGVIYTLGVVLYSLGKKKMYFHSIFHIFVLIATAMMFLSIYYFVL